MILLGFTSMALALYGLYFVMYQSPENGESRRGISLENYDLDWSDFDDESVSDSIDQNDLDEDDLETKKADQAKDTELTGSDSESESEDEEREQLAIRRNRVTHVTLQDLADWGIEARIEEICQKIGEQLKDQCLQELLEDYLKDPDYRRNPSKGFRRIFRKRGHIQHLRIPEDLPLVALHKLHETPEYLDQIHRDRSHLRHQVLSELKEKQPVVE